MIQMAKEKKETEDENLAAIEKMLRDTIKPKIRINESQEGSDAEIQEHSTQN